MAHGIDDDELEELEEQQAKERSGLRPHVVHEVIRREGELELERPASSLAWSGLAAGLSMGLSLLGQALLRAHLPEASWSPLVEALGYTLGFIVVVTARQQLFTENTLVGIIPLLVRPSRKALGSVARLWSIVLFANLIGVFVFATAVGRLPVVDPMVAGKMAEIGRHAMQPGWASIFVRAILAGWLIALMVWMLPGAEHARVIVILVMTWLVGIGGFAHVIAGSADTFFLVAIGETTFGHVLWHYLVPTLLGNVIGGVALVSAVNHAQVVAGEA